MTANISQGSLLEFFEEEWGEGTDQFGNGPADLCLVTGTFARRNRRDALTRRGIDFQFTSISTIENTAKRLLAAGDVERPRILNRQLKRELVEQYIETVHQGNGPTALRSLISDIQFDDELYDTFLSELDAYYRAWDAGADNELVSDVAQSTDDTVVAERSQRVLEAFDELTAELEPDIEDQRGVFLSRNHLVRAARQNLPERWMAAVPDIEWNAVKTVNAYDNTTLRFFKRIADLEGGPDVYFFFDRETHDRLRNRFNTAGIATEEVAFPRDQTPGIEELVSIAASEQPNDPERLAAHNNL